MTPAQVDTWVNDIRILASDAEAAHKSEDDLYLALLTAIAEGRCKDPAECARVAIQSKNIAFHRWCA